MESWTKFLREQDSDTEPFKGTPAQRVLQRNIHFIRSKDATGQMACYYVLVPHTKRSLFLAALKQPETISLEDYGEIVGSNYGYKPNEQTKRILRERFGLEV